MQGRREGRRDENAEGRPVTGQVRSRVKMHNFFASHILLIAVLAVRGGLISMYSTSARTLIGRRYQCAVVRIYALLLPYGFTAEMLQLDEPALCKKLVIGV